MTLRHDRKDHLTQQAIEILLAARKMITDHSDLMWTSFETAEAFREDIDKCIDGLKNGDSSLLDSAYAHFQPSFDLQEHAMQNDWTNEYLPMAARFDKVYAQLKPLLQTK